MKNLLRTTNLFSTFLLAAVVFVGCVKKDDYYKKNTDESNRKQVVQISRADEEVIAYARDVKATNDTFALIDVFRYPNSPADLNQPLTIKLIKNSTLISDYNTANGTSYLELPANSYTLLTDINNVTFQPGQGIASIKIVVNQSLLDLSETYALGFSIADAGTGAVINTNFKNALYSIGVKNKYDGHYEVTGTMVDVTNANLTGNYPMDVYLVTSGPNSVYMVDLAIGGAAHSILNGGSLSYYGGYSPQFYFNATDAVTAVDNAYGQGNNNRSGQLDVTGTNKFNADHSIDVKYFMLQLNNAALAPSYVRTKFDEHFKYLGPR